MKRLSRIFSLSLENFRISLVGNISFFKELFYRKKVVRFPWTKDATLAVFFYSKVHFTIYYILSLAALFVEVNFVRNEHHVLKMVCTCVRMFAS